MKKLFKKTTSTILALAVSFQTASINITNAIKANAENTNPTYTVYGDLNSDKEIDVFDLVHMRKNIQAEHASDSLDLNLDEVIDEDDLLELQDYSLGVSTFFAAYMSDDADNDGLCDAIELSTTKSNPNSEDTDGDGLTDYEEVFLTLTSPVEKYTINSKLSDSQADSDNDKITNIDEITTYKTNPILDDTDEDGINDYDEIFTHKTKPLVTDTDEDGIDDYSELQLNLNPLLSKTHGDILDSEYKITQSISATSKVFNDINDINTEDSPYKMSIEINTNGYAEKELSVTESGYSHMIDSDAVIGSIVEISASEFCNPASLTIKYTVADKYKECALEEYKNIPELNGINNLCIFKYFEEINMLLPVETLFSGNTVYTVTDELGTYCLVDLSKWFDSLNISPTDIKKVLNNPTDYSSQISLANEEIDIQTDLGSNSTESNKSTKPIDIVFLLQMTGLNPDDNTHSSILYQAYLIEQFSRYIFEKFSNAKVYYIAYSYTPAIKEDDGITYEYKTNIYKTKSKAYYATDAKEICYMLYGDGNEIPIDSFSELPFDTGLELYQKLELQNNVYTYQFINNSYEPSQANVDFCLNNTGVFSLISDRVYNPSTGKISLEQAIKTKDGVYITDFFDDPSHSKTDYDLVKDAITKITHHFNVKEELYKYDVLLNNTPTSLVLEDELKANNGADTDHDGCSDWEEFNTEFLNISDDGTAIPCTFEEIIAKGYAGDYLANAGGNTTARQQMFNSIHDKEMYVMKSDPTKNDSDMDGVPDKDDPDPLRKGELKPFGTPEYENEVNKKVNDLINSSSIPSFSTVTYNFPIEYLNISNVVSIKQIALELGKEKAICKASIDIMMKDVNNCEEYLQYISDEDWTKFCLYFNKHVQEYRIVDKELHYFRLKLNRAPETLDDMIDLINSSKKDDKWKLYSMLDTRYHMFGTDGEFNLKFGSSKNTGYCFEAVYNKDGKLLTEENSPVNIGTYNYCSDQADEDLHQELDVKPYKEFGNTPDTSSKYPGQKAKDYNRTKYNNNKEAQNHRKSVEGKIKQ